MTEIAAGDRVCHVGASAIGTGTVERIIPVDDGAFARIRWDHFGLAIAALGSMADLQRLSLLEKVDA